MKFNPWMIPGLAVIGLGGWIGARKTSSAALEREITVITERIRQVRSGEAADITAGGDTGASSDPKDGKIDWKDIAGKMNQMESGGMQDMRVMMRMQRLLLDLSAEELSDQLDEIASLDIKDDARRQLQGMILGALAEKDPKLALQKCAHAIGDEDSGMYWQLGHALQKWADTEPAAAVAWLDQQIASGKLESKSLDGRNQALIRMENSLVGALLKSDPAAATARVAALPESQREQFFQQGFYIQIQKDNEGAYAKLVRDTMPAERVGEILANTAGILAMQGNFERVDGFIANSHTTDDEKKTIVKEVIKNRVSHGDLKPEEIEKFRAWGSRQAPDVVDQATGEAIASSLWRGDDFKTASELALKYNESSPNDDVLVAFLKSDQLRHRAADEAKPLIDKIKDPAVQDEIRKLPQFKD